MMYTAPPVDYNVELALVDECGLVRKGCWNGFKNVFAKIGKLLLAALRTKVVQTSE